MRTCLGVPGERDYCSVVLVLAQVPLPPQQCTVGIRAHRDHRPDIIDVLGPGRAVPQRHNSGQSYRPDPAAVSSGFERTRVGDTLRSGDCTQRCVRVHTRVVNLRGNALSGTIPSGMGALAALR